MRIPARPTSRLTSAVAALAIGLGLVALSGCSGGGDSSAASDATVAGAAAAAARAPVPTAR